ncbi:MAG: acyltransferase [Nitrospinae bacterium]|nr:acyltransferase [Nitrospinota bacterium]
MKSNSNPINNNVSYRPDIDGIRAIAVLAVVLFHAFPGYVRGGFLGVDVFFVISGYLISTIIFDALAKRKFTFIDFYSRRIRRIFPALFIVLLASMFFGWLALLPDEYESLGKHVAAGVAFISNLVLLQEVGYFDTASSLKPLLHLWSLGIEEQFYIIWPFVLYLFWKKPTGLFWLICSILLFSFLSSSAFFQKDPAFAFYLPFTRFWELMLGSLLAYLIIFQETGTFFHRRFVATNQSLSRKSVEILSGIGFLMMTVPLFIGGSNKSFSAFLILIPTLGTLILIAVGKDSYLSRRLLSNSSLVFIGLISFPLYMWHWPLLSFAYIIEAGLPDREIRISLVLLSFVLAWVTYIFIEKPIRKKRGFSGIPLTRGLCVVTLLLGISGYVTFHFKGFNQRIAVNDFQTTSLIGEKVLSKKTNLLGTITVFGDSHAGQISKGLSMNGVNNLQSYVRGTCLPIKHVYTYRRPTQFQTEDTGCQPWIDNTLNDLIASKNIDVVILSTFYNQYLDGRIPISSPGLENHSAQEIFSLRLYETVKALSESGKKVVLTLDVPEFMEACLPPRPYLFKDQSNCEISRDEEKKQLNVYASEIKKLVKEFSGVTLYDPRNLLCDKEKCFAKKGGAYLYRFDGNHLTENGVRLLGADLIKSLN